MSDPAPPPTSPLSAEFDPDHYRMTIGEHLEELRTRLIRALLGTLVVFIVCCIWGNQVLLWFCRPMYSVLEEKGLNTQLRYDTIGEPLTTWLAVNLITAAAIASPWIAYQFWLFVAAGLYPAERKYITKYLPVSIFLLIAGMAFVYFLVLPWSLSFVIDFANTVPVPGERIVTTRPHTPATIPSLAGDPATPMENEIWIDETTSKIKIFHDGQIRSIRFTTENLLAPDFKLAQYISLVVGMLIAFGLSFQLPLVVLALARIGIFDVDQLRAARKYVYFALAIAAAAITPGDIITATVALMVPLGLLYELGLWLAAGVNPRGGDER
jgi:sec-independent protein translocase protein TatC